MLTRCNRCATKFEISAELVHSDDATVRCGECRTIFNARDCLVDEDLEYRQQFGEYPPSSEYAGLQTPAQTAPQAPQQAPAQTPPQTPRQQPAPRSAPREPVVASVQSVQPEAEMSAVGADDTYALESGDTLVIDRNIEYVHAATQSPVVARAETPVQTGFAERPLDTDVVLSEIAEFPSDTAATGYEFESTLALDGLTGIEKPYDISSADVAEKSPYQESARESAQPAAKPAVQHSVAAAPPQVTTANAGMHADPDVVLPESKGGTRREQPNYQHGNGLPEVAIDDDYPELSDEVLDDRAMLKTGPASTDREFDSYGVQETRRAEDAYVPVSYQSAEPPTGQKLGRRGKRSVDVSRRSLWPVLLVVPVLIASMLYLLRDSIPGLPLPKSVLEPVCELFGCDLPLQQDLSSIHLLDRKIVSHPTEDDALYISIDIVNKAEFVQEYPVLAITLANSLGEAVASRDFKSQDYLARGLVDNARLEPNKPVRINLEIIDPGEDAKSFEIEFR